MHEYLKAARSGAAKRLKTIATEKSQKVDSSTWSPAPELEAGKKTGMRPISKRAFKSGGKVVGKIAKVRADRVARKSGGKVTSEQPPVDRYINRDLKKANDYREGGDSHVGALKSGGRTKKDIGGGMPFEGANTGIPVGRGNAKFLNTGLKRGGAAKKNAGGPLLAGPASPEMMAKRYATGPSAVVAPNAPPRKLGGRANKANGGSTDEFINRQVKRSEDEEVKFPKNVPLPRPRPKSLDASEYRYKGPKRDLPKPGLPGYKKGGKANWEGSAKDEAQDKKLAAKRGISMKQWEASKADDKHDSQQSMKGLKKGGRIDKEDGGPIHHFRLNLQNGKDKRTQNLSFGGESPADALINRIKFANAGGWDVTGAKHTGSYVGDKKSAGSSAGLMKKGGRAHKAGGGMNEQAKMAMIIANDPHSKRDKIAGFLPPSTRTSLSLPSLESGASKMSVKKAHGGRAHKASGGLSEFGQAFKEGRAAMLAGGPKTFEYNGKMYNTNLAKPSEAGNPPRRGVPNPPSATERSYRDLENTTAKNKANFEYSKRVDEVAKGVDEAAKKRNEESVAQNYRNNLAAAGKTAIEKQRDRSSQADTSSPLAPATGSMTGQVADPTTIRRQSGQRSYIPGIRMGDPRLGEPAMVFGGEKRGGRIEKRAKRKDGGKVFTGGSYPNKIPGVVPGGRVTRAEGGAVGKKGGTNINIIISPKSPDQGLGGMPPMPMDAGPPPMPPMMPPEAGPPPMGGGIDPNVLAMLAAKGGGGGPPPMGGPMMPPPGAPPMMRKSGGRTTYPITTASGGGNARLEKVPAYGLKQPTF